MQTQVKEAIVEIDEALKSALEQKLKTESDVEAIIVWITVIP